MKRMRISYSDFARYHAHIYAKIGIIDRSMEDIV